MPNLLAFVGDIYEDLELWYPKIRMEEAGYGMKLAAEEIRTHAGKHGYPATADVLLQQAKEPGLCGVADSGRVHAGQASPAQGRASPDA
ncbi:MAG: hypothetical protein U0744_10055 [Gemmataceae bacterium]